MFGIACTVFWKQFLSDFYATKLSILIWNSGELFACHYSIAKYVLFLVNCDQIPCSEIQSLVLKQLPIVTPHNGSKHFKHFTPIHPVKSCPCLQSLHYPTFQLSLSFFSTKYPASIINNDATRAKPAGKKIFFENRILLRVGSRLSTSTPVVILYQVSVG